jgi:ornithine cyclodeaminase/alanine dehydrogenase-like protein (mu-crystallin family)
MKIISSEQVDQLLDYPALVAALNEAFRGDYVVPKRHHHEISPTATHLLMPAWTGGAPKPGAYLGTKLVNIFSQNAALGLPAVAGTYVLQSGETGIPLCVMDGTRLTVWRTAAVSALAASFLARKDACHLVMVGAGALAPCLIRAHCAVRPITRVTLWNRTRANSEKLAALLHDTGLVIDISDDLASAVAGADIVSAATLSQQPLIFGKWLKPGAHIDLVGAFNLNMREADDEALQRAQVFVDTPAAKTEGGDVALGLASGAIPESHVLGDLFALTRGTHPGRQSDAEITLFKSVGTAISDLAAAMLVWMRAQKS